MWFTKATYDGYTHPTDQCEIESSYRKKSARFLTALSTYFFLGSFCLISGLTVGLQLGKHMNFLLSRTATEKVACSSPATRLEWRSLSSDQKKSYLDAVTCLKMRPSRIIANQTLYDDFPYIHFRLGEYSHHAAAFLAWHRNFISSYEQALRNDCGYTGHLAYWDWTLDWEDITTAPIWSALDGFGTDGNTTFTENDIEGYCVTDGPFAHYEIPYIDEKYTPHCLSRQFLRGPALTEYGTWFQPSKIIELLGKDDYEEFLFGLEDGPHIAIPRSIRGDFGMLTAPSDPVFFLHHTQLDRLWWLWQQRDVKNRLWQYKGLARHMGDGAASLDDLLPLGNVGLDVRARDVMLTEGNHLCYRY